MGSLLSKPSKNTTTTSTRYRASSSHEASSSRVSGFEQFSESLRRSFRIKRQSSGVHTDHKGTNLTNMASTPSRPEIPQSFRQASTENTESKTSHPPPRPSQPPTETKTTTFSAEKKAEAPSRPTPPAATATITNKAENISPPSSPGVRNVLETVAQETRAVRSDAAANLMSNIHHENEAKPAAASLLMRLAPEEKSADPTPERETAPKPTVSLLAALEKRKEAKEEHKDEEKATTSPSSQMVLETIANDASVIKSSAAATLMAAFIPSEHQEEKENKGVSEPEIKEEVKPSKRKEQLEFVLSKLPPGELTGEESTNEQIAATPAARLMAAMEKKLKSEEVTLDAPEAESALTKSTEVDKLKSALTSKLSAFAEKQAVDETPVVAEQKSSQSLDNVKDVLAKLGDDKGSDVSDIDSTPTRPAVNLLAALRKKKEEDEKEKEEEEEHKKISPPSSPSVKNVLESVASGVLEVKSTQAHTLMASFVPDEKPKETPRTNAGSILAKLAPEDENSPAQTPDQEIEVKPVSQLLSALQRKQESTKEENENDSPRSTGVANVMESIASDAVVIKSKEAASLMAAFVPSTTVSVDSNNEEGLKNGEK